MNTRRRAFVVIGLIVSLAACGANNEGDDDTTVDSGQTHENGEVILTPNIGLSVKCTQDGQLDVSPLVAFAGNATTDTEAVIDVNPATPDLSGPGCAFTYIPLHTQSTTLALWQEEADGETWTSGDWNMGDVLGPEKRSGGVRPISIPNDMEAVLLVEAASKEYGEGTPLVIDYGQSMKEKTDGILKHPLTESARAAANE